MNRSTTTSSARERGTSLLTSATEDEITVAQILLDLKNLMSLSESLAKFNWGSRRRRSFLDAAPPSRPSTSVRRTDDKIQQSRGDIKAEEADGAARTTASPDTPFSFSPSDESDEKSKHSSKKTSKKRSREEFLDMIEGLTKTKDLLRGEIENVRKYYNKLKSYNSQLKAIKQEVLNSSLRKEEEPPMEISQHYGEPLAQYSVNHVGPFEFDLNVPAEEAFGFGVDLCQPLDVSRAIADKRARFAEARRKRRGIIKIKARSIRNGVSN